MAVTARTTAALMLKLLVLVLTLVLVLVLVLAAMGQRLPAFGQRLLAIISGPGGEVTRNSSGSGATTSGPGSGATTSGPRSEVTTIGFSQGCAASEFTCTNGMCIRGDLRCNDDHDCDDGSDERGCLESRVHGDKNPMTLAFVFDSTNSMDEELDQVKEAMQEIFDYMRTNRPEIVNYALVEFHDPEAHLLSITNDSHIYQESLDSIEIYGGEDCPEMAIEGIKIALEQSLPNSFIFVFTDASAKDYSNEPVVQDLIQRKKSKVIFILTGRCTNEDDEAENFLFEQGYKVYKNISHSSNGYVLTLEKSDVNKVLEFIKLNIGKKEVICVKDIEGAGDCTAPVDESVGRLAVTIVGSNATVRLEDPTGREVDGNDTLDLPSAISRTIDNPKTGNWKIKVRVQSSGRFIVMADSSFSIIYGFSANSTDEMNEASQRPIAGVNTSILIQASNHTNSIHLTDIKVKDSEYNVIETMALYPVVNKNATYKSGFFLPPNSTFFLEVNGKDSRNNSVTRISETGIMPLPPGPPHIAPDTELIATLKNPFNLMCHVESLVPFTVSWHKGNVQISPVKQFSKTAMFYYHIDNVTQLSEGKYTCKANNTIGTVSQSIQLHVKAPPPRVETQHLIEIVTNKTGEISCQIESDLNYTLKWTKRDKSGLMPIDSSAKFNIKPTGSLLIYSVQKSDEGEYNCSAQSTSGKGENITIVKVIEPVKVVITSNTMTFRNGSNIQLNCSATGTSTITLVWQKNDIIFQETDPRVKTYGENKVILNITNGYASDEGHYQCTGRNKFSTGPPPSTCSPLEFGCDGGLCLSSSFRCNNIFDCVDMTDEQACEERCLPGQFHCNDGDCIPEYRRCDNYRDCSDDELNCGLF